MTRFYLWEIDPFGATTPRRMAEVEVDGPTIRVLEAADEEIRVFIAAIAGYPTLPLRTTSLQGDPAAPVMATSEVQVGPDHPDYVHAVCQVAARASGFAPGYTPEGP